MSVPREKLREALLQMLYSLDIGQGSPEEAAELLSEELKLAKSAMREVTVRALAIREKLSEIDTLIAKTSVSYSLDRIHSVERNVLRLGIYELLYDKEIPPKVAIAEAVRLARKFGSPEALTFVNAVLDSIYQAQKEPS